MKALLVIDSDTTYSACKTLMQLTGFDSIRYRHPVKAIDNIEEIAPDIMVIHTGDFPRHWKTLVQFAAASSLLAATHVVLIKTPFFSREEAEKAAELGITEIIGDPAAMNNLADAEKMIRKYVPQIHAASSIPPGHEKKESPPEPVYLAPAANPVICLFSNPASGSIITGNVNTVSRTGFTFVPDSPAMLSGMSAAETIADATVKINGKIITPQLAATTDGTTLRCSFTSMTADEKKVLETYLKFFES